MNKILLLVLLLLTEPASALMLSTSYVSGGATMNYGGSSVEAVSNLNLTGATFTIDHEFSYLYVYSTYQSSNHEFKSRDKTLKESIFDIFVGKKFGSKDDYLALIIGTSSQQLVFGYVENSSIEFSEVKTTSLCAGFRINSKVLSYEYQTHQYNDTELNDLEMPGTMTSHKISLNFGNKFKYGFYYLNQYFDFKSNSLINWKTYNLGALYLGYEF